MPLQVPIPLTVGEAHITWVTQLENVDYRFTLLWVERQQAWFLSLGIASPAQDLLTGVRLVFGADLLAPYRNGQPSLPRGALALVTLIRSNRAAPGFGDLGEGRRVQLVYWSPDEMDAATEMA